MKPVLITIAFIILAPLAVFSQQQCPTGLICLTQEAANRAFENAKLRPALESKITVLEAALIEKDKNTQEVKDAAAKNEADLKAALIDTQVKLATATGQLIGTDAERNRLIAIIDVLVKSTRKKSIGLIAF